MGQQVGQLEKENGELKAAFQVRYQINCSSVSLETLFLVSEPDHGDEVPAEQDRGQQQPDRQDEERPLQSLHQPQLAQG